jgi:ribonuclease HI
MPHFVVGSHMELPPGDDAPPSLLSPEATYVLFFDGGSRGNPGPGGSGACVVRVGEQTGRPALVWSVSIRHAHRSTTNKQAEYRGLITSLRAARRYQWPRLEVVGDSAHILRQLRDYRPPKNPRLLALYSQARRLADQLGVRRWCDHVRAHNKMADALANLAMDCRTSSQVRHPSARPPGH